MFSDPEQISDNYLLHFIARSKLLQLLPGTAVLNEGEFGRDIYFILEGRFVVSSAGTGGQDFPIAVLRRGEFMGEHGMLTGQQRTASVRAQTTAVSLEVPEQVIQQMMDVAPSVRSYFERLNAVRSIESILKRLALFQGISSADVHWIAGKMQMKTYDRDTLLFTESEGGQPARESMHVILEGFVKVARRTEPGTGQNKGDERIIAYRQSGDYFAGGLDMLGDGRAVSVTAINRVHVAEIASQDMQSILSRYPEVNQRFTMRVQEYQAMTKVAQTFVGTIDFLRAHPEQKQAVPEARAAHAAHCHLSRGIRTDRQCAAPGETLTPWPDREKASARVASVCRVRKDGAGCFFTRTRISGACP